MAYDRQQLRIDWGFSIEGTDEVAVTGLSFAAGTGWAGAEAALLDMQVGVVAPTLLGDMLTFMSTTQLNWADYSELNYCKIAAVGVDGHYLDFPENPVLFEDPTPDDGTFTIVLPQSTIVLSLRSGFTTGQANYGRMYLPHTRHTQAGGSSVGSVANSDLIAEAGATFIEALKTDITAATSSGILPMIMSAAGSGTAREVVSVAVGTVTDTQRRRRNKLTEVYSFHAVS
jgi:hypothetical protein